MVRTIWSHGYLPEVWFPSIKGPLVAILNKWATGGKVTFRDLLDLYRLIKRINSEMPIPTHENVDDPEDENNANFHALIDLRDWFFEHFTLSSRHDAMWALWNFGIAVYRYDGCYTDWINATLEKWRTMTWVPLALGHPTPQMGWKA